MPEFPDVEERRAMLRQMIGTEHKVWTQVGDLDRTWPVAHEDLERADADKTSAVHFLRFELTPVQIDALKGGAGLAAGIDHDHYQVEIRPVAENIRQSLIGDLD